MDNDLLMRLARRVAAVAALSNRQLGFLLHQAFGGRHPPASIEGVILREVLDRLGFDLGPPEQWQPPEG